MKRRRSAVNARGKGEAFLSFQGYRQGILRGVGLPDGRRTMPKRECVTVERECPNAEGRCALVGSKLCALFRPYSFVRSRFSPPLQEEELGERERERESKTSALRLSRPSVFFFCAVGIRLMK